MKTNKGFGEWLRDEREGKGISQPDMAAFLKIGESTLSAYETGRRKPTEKFILKLAKAFKLTEAETFQRFAEAGLWDGPTIADNDEDWWWVSRCKRFLRDVPRDVIEDTLPIFEAAIKSHRPRSK